MVSQFGSLGYTIMRNTADLTVSRRQSLTPFTRRVSPKHSSPRSWLFTGAVSKHANRKLSGRKKCRRKDAQSPEKNRSLRRISPSKSIQKEIWVNFPMNGLRLGSRSHDATTHDTCSRNLATVWSSEASDWAKG